LLAWAAGLEFTGRAPDVARRRARRSVSLSAIVNAEDTNQIRRLQNEKKPPLADPEAQFTGPIFEGLHIAVACRAESYQGGVDPCLNDSIKARQIAYRGRAKNDAADHSPSRRLTSSSGTSSPGSVRARSSLCAVSSSRISCSPNSARRVSYQMSFSPN
jgi:hypothetical protein